MGRHGWVEARARVSMRGVTTRAHQPVSAADLEHLLGELNRAAGGASGELFGADSISWRVNREAGLFLAAGYATLLQLAHPWVAAAIAEHSKTLHDPIGRFHQTFRVMFTLSFGPIEHAMAMARRMHHRHQSIRGTMPETVGGLAKGSRYDANEVQALLWVYATLIDTSVLAHDLILPALTSDERERYYAESRTSAAFFGIPLGVWPPDWRRFEEYKHSMFASATLAVSPVARDIATQVLSGAGSWLRIPSWYRALTAHLLPAQLREQFGLAYGESERRSAERVLSWIRRVYPRLPESVRFVGPYREALGRINGRPHASVSVRLSNRLWVGETTLFSPPKHM